MACRDDYPNFDYARLNERTNQLCTQLAYLEQSGFERLIHESVRVWWEDHKKADAERLEQERLEADLETQRKRALAKLSQEERDILGLK